MTGGRDRLVGCLHTSRGFFVAFEGGEGAGKSTQVRLLAKCSDRAGARGADHVRAGRHRGGTPAARDPARPRDRRLDPRTEALLYAADRAEHVASVVAPALDRGAVCITDRYIDSSIAYQGAGRTLDPCRYRAASRRGRPSGLWPDLTVVLDIDPADRAHAIRHSRRSPRVRAARLPPASSRALPCVEQREAQSATSCSTPRRRLTTLPLQFAKRCWDACHECLRCHGGPATCRGDAAAVRCKTPRFRRQGRR